MSTDAGWLITKSGAIPPPSGSIHGSAYLVKVMRGSSKRDVIVEFADSSAVISNGYAEEVTRRYLRDSEPPQHLVVEIEGTVRIERGPREGVVDDIDGDELGLPPARSPQRARSHRRGS
jgi:hypothetical protein